MDDVDVRMRDGNDDRRFGDGEIGAPFYPPTQKTTGSARGGMRERCRC